MHAYIPLTTFQSVTTTTSPQRQAPLFISSRPNLFNLKNKSSPRSPIRPYLHAAVKPLNIPPTTPSLTSLHHLQPPSKTSPTTNPKIQNPKPYPPNKPKKKIFRENPQIAILKIQSFDVPPPLYFRPFRTCMQCVPTRPDLDRRRVSFSFFPSLGEDGRGLGCNLQ